MARTPSMAAIRAEELLLDRITLLLDMRQHRKGLTDRQIADALEVSIGNVQLILKASECILRRSRSNRKLWINDWRECLRDFRPQRLKASKAAA